MITPIQTSIEVITPGGQAITTDDGKQHIRLEYDTVADNAEVDNMILTATEEVEVFTSRICMETVFDFHLTGFPIGGIVLPYSPVSAITSIKYYDTSNVEQTWNSSNYFYNIYEEPCRIRYIDGIYPTTYENRFDAVTIRFTAGYASDSDIPKTIRQAILLKLGDLYSNRGDAVRERFTLWQMTCYGKRVIHLLNENGE